MNSIRASARYEDVGDLKYSDCLTTWRIAVRQEPPSGQQAGSRPYKEPSKDATQSLKPTDPTHYKQNAL